MQKKYFLHSCYHLSIPRAACDATINQTGIFLSSKTVDHPYMAMDGNLLHLANKPCDIY